MSEIKDFWDDQDITVVPYVTGSVLMMPFTVSSIGTLCPGFLFCDGAALSRTTYSDLYSVIGTKYGYTASTNFRVPDYRGKFFRSRDNGGGADPDIGSRTSNVYSTGTQVGSVQTQMIDSHRHYIEYDNNTSGNIGWADDNRGVYSITYTNASGGNETRPRNFSMVFIIKY